MALIVITIKDLPDDEVYVTVVASPRIKPQDEKDLLTGAHVAALNMLRAMQADIKTDLKAFISKEPL